MQLRIGSNVRIESILDICLSDILIKAAAVERGDVDVLRGLEVWHSLRALEQLLSHRIVDAIVPGGNDGDCDGDENGEGG